MKHLLAFLAGIGSSINAFGTLPQYEIPKRGDCSRDFYLIGRDMKQITARIERQAGKAITEKYGKVYHRAS